MPLKNLHPYWIALLIAAAGRAAAAEEAQLTLSRDAALWSDVVRIHIEGVGCDGPASDAMVHFPSRLIDIDLEGCSNDPNAHFSHVVEVGPLLPEEYTVRVFNSIRHIVSPPPPPLDTATLTVHRDADLRAEVPATLLSSAEFLLTMTGPASSQCHLIDEPVVAGNVITMGFHDECPILPIPGAVIFRHAFPIGPLPAGEYEVRMFENEFGPVPAMARRTIVVHDQAGCIPSATALCLGGRFRVEAAWEDFAHRTGAGQALPLADREDSGLFWFFDEDNVELTVKVLDGCAVNDRHWVFVSSGSTVRWTVTVTDTALLAQRTYGNALGEAAPLIADTVAFACAAP